MIRSLTALTALLLFAVTSWAQGPALPIVPAVGPLQAYPSTSLPSVNARMRVWGDDALHRALLQLRGSRRAGFALVSTGEESLAQQLENELIALIEKSMPAVIQIRLGNGVGSGFLVNAKGYLLTNRHVVESAGKWGLVTVMTNDEVPFPAKVVALDKTRDLALLRIASPRTNWPVLEFADDGRAVQGRFVIALGHPFGVPFSSSFGIVTGVNREGPGQMSARYVQTDTVINPGNSGGPLIGLDGKVLGVNNFIISPGRRIPGYDGMGFAIRAEDAKAFLELALPEEEPAAEPPKVIGPGVSVAANDSRRFYR